MQSADSWLCGDTTPAKFIPPEDVSAKPGEVEAALRVDMPSGSIAFLPQTTANIFFFDFLGEC